MKPEAQNIAIAEACGWSEIISTPYDPQPPKGRECGGANWGKPIPNYAGDLNAMHEAELAVIYAAGYDSDLALDYQTNVVVSADVGMSQSASAADFPAILKTRKHSSCCHCYSLPYQSNSSSRTPSYGSFRPFAGFLKSKPKRRTAAGFTASLLGLLKFSKYWMPPFLAIGFAAAFFGR